MTESTDQAQALGHPPVDRMRETVVAGGAAKYHEANAAKGKLFARERVRTGSWRMSWPVISQPTG